MPNFESIDFSSDTMSVTQFKALLGNFAEQLNVLATSETPLALEDITKGITQINEAFSMLITLNNDRSASELSQIELMLVDIQSKLDNGDFIGAKGDSFTFDDFTPEQIETLKVKGDSFTYSDFTPEQLQSLSDNVLLDYNNLLNRPSIASFIDLSSQAQLSPYRKTVIALCVLDNTNPELNSCSMGELMFHRNNGIVDDVVFKFTISKYYDTENSVTRAIIDSDHCSFCVFEKDGIKYGGVHYFQNNANSHQVFFHGFTNSNIFAIDYYDTRGTILDTEVNNTLVIS